MKKLTNLINVFAIILIINVQWAKVHGQAVSTQKGLTYQAVARNASGNIIANQNISVRFSLITGSASGPVYYQETQSLTTNSLGLFNTTIFVGASVSTTGTFNPSAWQVIASLGAFIKVEMDITGGSTYVDMGTTQMISVPFALYAEASGVTPGSVNFRGTWDASLGTPPATGSPDIKGHYYTVSVAGSTMLNGISDWQVGDWVIYNGTIWQKVDNSEASDAADNIAFTPTTDITSTNVQDAVEEVSDSSIAGRALLNSKLTTLTTTLTSALTAKTDKVIGATNGHFAGLDANGNLTDSGKNPSSFLPSSTTATNIPFTPSGNIISANVQDAIAEVDADFADVIDSYIHQTEDGVYIYEPTTGIKRFGIGVTQPDYPLGIKAEGTTEALISFHDPGLDAKWLINMNPGALGNTGFNIDQQVGTGKVSRLFIQESDGYIGLGTATPSQKLHIEESVSTGIIGLQIRNTATAVNNGFVMGHRQSTVTEKNGAFSIIEEGSIDAERMTFRHGGNVGINETLPYATLHISRDPLDPQSAINLAENTGILVLGPIDDKNLGMDAHQIQARTGEYIGTTLSFTATPLGLQPYGGGVIINANSSLGSEKAIITSDAKLGLGTVTPLEKIDIDGAIKIGTTANTNVGTIRYTGTDFEGRVGTGWVSLTAGNGPWTTGAGNSIYYLGASNSRIGVGTNTPDATLDIDDSETVTGGNTAVNIHNSSTTSSSSSNNRVGLGINCNGVWSPNPAALNIGLYVSNVTGQTNTNSNIGAVINGNTVIGDVTGSSVVGAGGTNVLAIQTGSVPTTIPGTTATTGIQIYSDNISTGAGSPPISVFNVMTGDGHVIKLFRSSALTAPDNSSVGSTYGANEQTIINNMRDRINALEAKLQAFGLLE